MDDWTSAQWFRREAARLEEMGWLMGSPLERTVIASWRQDSPKAVAEFEELGILEVAAFVLVDKMLEAQRENLKAGMPLTDAREQAYADWLYLGDEAEEQ